MEKLAIAVGVLAVLVVGWIWIAAGRRSRADHGTVSGSWLAEQRRLSDEE